LVPFRIFIQREFSMVHSIQLQLNNNSTLAVEPFTFSRRSHRSWTSHISVLTYLWYISLHSCAKTVQAKPEIDRIVFANHSRFTRIYSIKPRIVRNIESSFIFLCSLLRTNNMLKSAINRFFNLYPADQALIPTIKYGNTENYIENNNSKNNNL
jgi:prephenate dehydrogenase